MPRQKRAIPEINAGSMADIAFLLLIFFLVTTSIDSDKGIAIKLPPKFDKTQVLQKIQERNIFEVLINSQNQLLVEGENMERIGMRERAVNIEQQSAATARARSGHEGLNFQP